MPPQLLVAHDHDFRNFELRNREFQRGGHAVTAAVSLERRHEIGDVPDHEDLARIGVENGRRVGPAVAAGDDHRTRRSGPSASCCHCSRVGRRLVRPEAPIAIDQIAKAAHRHAPLMAVASRSRAGVASGGSSRYLARHERSNRPFPGSASRTGSGSRRRRARAMLETRNLMRSLGLATVCEEAACPNIGECWTKKHATVMILGDTCTRACAFCNVKTGMPRAVDPLEPEHVAIAAAELGLEHIVITSVDRDDLPDGGASQFVKVIDALRRNTPNTTIEILTPDFRNKSEAAVEAIVDAGPDVYNHNLETVPRLYPTIRPGARYYASLRLLESVKRRAPHYLHQVGCDGRPRRAASGGAPGDGRHALCRRRFPDHGPVSAAHAAPRKGRGIRHSAGVRRVCGDRAGQGLPARRSFTADAVELSRRRRFQEDAGGPQRAAGAGERLMPRHTETKHLPYTPDQLFDLVADVARYDEFLPWVVAVRVRSSSPTETIADLVVGFNAFKERFTSRVMKERPNRICVDYIEGPLKYPAQRVEVRPRARWRHQSVLLGRFRIPFADLRGARGPDVRPSLAANDARLRGARGRALRHQQIERAERRLKPDPGAPGFIEELLVGMNLRRILAPLGASEDDGADRLSR